MLSHEVALRFIRFGLVSLLNLVSTLESSRKRRRRQDFFMRKIRMSSFIAQKLRIHERIMKRGVI